MFTAPKQNAMVFLNNTHLPYRMQGFFKNDHRNPTLRIYTLDVNPMSFWTEFNRFWINVGWPLDPKIL